MLHKADTILDFDCCEKCVSEHGGKDRVFTAGWHYAMLYYSRLSHQEVNHETDLEPLNWRENPKNLLNNTGGNILKHVEADSPCFCTTKTEMDRAGWYDENLKLWGCWQMALQRAMLKSGTQFIVIPEILQYHMNHPIIGGETDPGVSGGRQLESGAALEEWSKSPISSMK